MHWKFWGAIMLGMTLVACMPYPHTYQRLPRISGLLLENGAPVTGAQIYLGEKSDVGTFKSVEGPVTTATDGSFAFDGERRVRLYILGFPAEHLEMWALRIDERSYAPYVYTRGNLRPGPVSAPEFLALRCDLARRTPCEIVEEKHGKW